MDEDRDDARFAVRVLAGTVDVGVAQAGGVETVLLVVEEQIALAREFGDAVGGEWACRMLFIRREDVLLTVHGAAGGGEDDLPDRARAGGLEEIEQSADVDIRVEAGIRNRPPNIHLCGVVNEHFDLFIDDRPGGLVGADVGDDEFGTIGNILLAAARQVVQNQNSVAIARQRLGNVTTDETGAPSDTYDGTHPRPPDSDRP